ncbi:hypothetical protein XELAEV_18011660mg [Xenopus laevis]|uniref:Uncharacterized protein n=1 Tax=Xenopus laevis TaxID=8355 RepID=A0A974DLR1_XENLA|nr:hypothetical protein XELAEV_18011660mg [Xenopus laevis]
MTTVVPTSHSRTVGGVWQPSQVDPPVGTRTLLIPAASPNFLPELPPGGQAWQGRDVTAIPPPESEELSLCGAYLAFLGSREHG